MGALATTGAVDRRVATSDGAGTGAAGRSGDASPSGVSGAPMSEGVVGAGGAEESVKGTPVSEGVVGTAGAEESVGGAGAGMDGVRAGS